MTTRGSASPRRWCRGRRPGRRVTRWRWRCAVTGCPTQILTDNGKVFTGRFGPGTGEVLFDRICRENGIKHLLTAPRSPTTTGKVERWHKTLRREFLDGKVFASIEDAQAQLDGWVRALQPRPTPSEPRAWSPRGNGSASPPHRVEPDVEPSRRARASTAMPAGDDATGRVATG